MSETRCGVYLIRNTTDGKVYVGSSIDIDKRWQSHINQMKGGRHQNAHLQSAWKKYGQGAFEFMVIEICPEGVLIVRETVWVEYYNSMNSDRGYNLEYPDRRSHTEATKQKIAQSHVGNPKCKGHKHSDEFKRRISDRHKGNQYNKGRVQSAEERRMRSEALKGKTTGKVLTEEHKKKLSEAHKGKIMSPEHRAKLSATTKKSWERNGKRRKGKVV